MIEVCDHDGVLVVRDDLFPGGTKARYLVQLFGGTEELVYASPAEGGAQTALATVAAQLGKRATIFVADRAKPHPRALMAKRLGAQVVLVKPGYLNVVQARAQTYCQRTGAALVPFGADTPEAIQTIADAARETGVEPAEVWCASGSGVLARGLALAFPKARRHVVQVGRELGPDDVAGATIHVYPRSFSQRAEITPPFPSDPHYDAKAWHLCRLAQPPCPKGPVLFWNVTGPAEP
jgi:hypothetical protein